MPRLLSLLALVGVAACHNPALSCKLLDGTADGLVAQLQQPANYEKARRYRYIQSAALEVKSYLLLRRASGEVKYHLTQHDLADPISQRLFDWKRTLFHHVARNADLPYKVKCYKKGSEGFFLVKAKRPLRSFDHAVAEMSIAQFTRYLANAAEIVAEYQSLGAALVELLEHSFFAEAAEMDQPALINFVALAKINQHCYVSRSLATRPGLFSAFVNTDKEKRLLPAAYAKPREPINTHTLIQFLRHAADLYVFHHGSRDVEVARSVKEFRSRVSQLESLGEEATIKDVVNQIETMMFFAGRGEEPLLKRDASPRAESFRAASPRTANSN